MSRSGKPFSYGKFTPAFADALAARLQGQRVLEVFAGNGLLAKLLSERGVQITATTILSGHDGHQFGMYHPVVEIDAVKAVQRFGTTHDVLLMSWPTVTEAATLAVAAWGSERAVLFIGEMPRPDLGMAGLQGCATDLFFEVTEVVSDLEGYTPQNMLERAVELRFRPPSHTPEAEDSEDETWPSPR